MKPPWFESDEQLLEELGRSLTDGEPDAEKIDMLMAGYDIVMADSVHAALVNDSHVDEGAAVRGEATGPRMLTFSADATEIDIELVDGRIMGRLSPTQEGTVYLDQLSSPAHVEPDDLGGFEFELRSPATFRIRFVTAGGHSIATAWIDGPHQTRPNRN